MEFLDIDYINSLFSCVVVPGVGYGMMFSTVLSLFSYGIKKALDLFSIKNIY